VEFISHKRLTKKNDWPMIAMGTGSIPRGICRLNSDVTFSYSLKKGLVIQKHIEYGEHIVRGISYDIKTALDRGRFLDKWNMVRPALYSKGVLIILQIPNSSANTHLNWVLTRASQIITFHSCLWSIWVDWVPPTNWKKPYYPMGYNCQPKPEYG